MNKNTRSPSSHQSRTLSFFAAMTSLVISLSFVGGQSIALAADTRVDGPETCYAFTLEITPKEGPAQRIVFATAGGKLDVSFVSEPADVEGVSIPILSGFRADVEPLENGKLWLRQLSLTHTIPYVTGITHFGSANTIPDGARTRTVPTRTGRSSDEGGSRGEVSGVATSSAVQQLNVGITTSLVLTLGKKITLFEDSKARIQLTVSKMTE